MLPLDLPAPGVAVGLAVVAAAVVVGMAVVVALVLRADRERVGRRATVTPIRRDLPAAA